MTDSRGAAGRILCVPRNPPAGPAAAASATEQADIEAALRRRLGHLTANIGERNILRPTTLQAAADWIAGELRALGMTVRRQPYVVAGHTVENIAGELPGRTTPEEIVVFGGHYDTVPGTVGADDNGSGIAALLTVAERAARARPERTVRVVAFVNEEPPFFHSSAMGSVVYAESCRARQEQVVGMLSVDSIGCYDTRPNSQSYPETMPADRLPSAGDFLAFATNRSSFPLLKESVQAFRRASPLPVEGVALDEDVAGVAWSDHWSFWRAGYPALFVTDTAVFRNWHYHTPSDTFEQVDFRSLSDAAYGLGSVLDHLSSSAWPRR
jgi:Zn-dependent M28 family amino/carboxypeptidase